MDIYLREELYRTPRPEEALDYLWGRLQDRDLSQDEALALLSAVHHQLSIARAGDPRAYFAYTRFMESLSREMPVVHDYVVARWIEQRRGAQTNGRRPAEVRSGDAALQAAV